MKRPLALILIACAAIAMQACDAQPAPPPARSYETGKLTIAGEGFAASEIADARAMPDMNKQFGLMISLTPAGAKRLESVTGALVGKPMLVALDGKTLVALMIRKPVTTGVIDIPGKWTLDEAETLARRIAGKDPLPDDLGV
jgi:preprotein translocase subunit SecD